MVFGIRARNIIGGNVMDIMLVITALQYSMEYRIMLNCILSFYEDVLGCFCLAPDSVDFKC